MADPAAWLDIEPMFLTDAGIGGLVAFMHALAERDSVGGAVLAAGVPVGRVGGRLMARVLTVGIAVVDFMFLVDRLPETARKHWARDARIVGGGCAASAAVAISRLGGEALLAARLGTDLTGEIILADLRREGVGTDCVQRIEGARSSFSSVSVDESGERQIVNFLGENLGADTSGIAEVRDVDAVLVDNRWFEGAVAGLARARELGVPGIVDAEPPSDMRILERASHIAFSRDGLRALAPGDDTSAALADAAVLLGAWACVTDGEKGVWFTGPEGIEHVPSCTVDAVDTLGAGDVWHGAFALALAEGTEDRDAIEFASAVAAIKCTRFGGRTGTPGRAEVARFMKENPA